MNPNPQELKWSEFWTLFPQSFSGLIYNDVWPDCLLHSLQLIQKVKGLRSPCAVTIYSVYMRMHKLKKIMFVVNHPIVLGYSRISCQYMTESTRVQTKASPQHQGQCPLLISNSESTGSLTSHTILFLTKPMRRAFTSCKRHTWRKKRL